MKQGLAVVGQAELNFGSGLVRERPSELCLADLIFARLGRVAPWSKLFCEVLRLLACLDLLRVCRYEVLRLPLVPLERLVSLIFAVAVRSEFLGVCLLHCWWLCLQVHVHVIWLRTLKPVVAWCGNVCSGFYEHLEVVVSVLK